MTLTDGQGGGRLEGFLLRMLTQLLTAVRRLLQHKSMTIRKYRNKIIFNNGSLHFPSSKILNQSNLEFQNHRNRLGELNH